jgi:hypothetical protein
MFSIRFSVNIEGGDIPYRRDFGNRDGRRVVEISVRTALELTFRADKLHLLNMASAEENYAGAASDADVSRIVCEMPFEIDPAQ